MFFIWRNRYDYTTLQFDLELCVFHLKESLWLHCPAIWPWTSTEDGLGEASPSQCSQRYELKIIINCLIVWNCFASKDLLDFWSYEIRNVYNVSINLEICFVLCCSDEAWLNCQFYMRSHPQYDRVQQLECIGKY